MLKVKSLQTKVLEPVSFELRQGECLAVFGPSGSGKSLPLRAIADLDPAIGDVFLDDKSRSDLSGPEWRRQVRYAAAEPGWWTDWPRDHFKDIEKAYTRAEALGLSKDVFERPISRLSTGERQRLALVRVVEDDPAVLPLDEPTGALDAQATEQAEALIQEMLGQETAIILVSHNPEQADRLANHRLVLHDGMAEMEAS